MDFAGQFLVLFAQLTEHFCLGFLDVCYGKHVADVLLELHIKEHEAAEQSVLGILYKTTYLPWCSSQHYTQLGAVQFDELPVLATA